MNRHPLNALASWKEYGFGANPDMAEELAGYAERSWDLHLAPENLAAIRGLAEIHHRLGDDHAHAEFHDAHHHAPPAPPADVAAPAAISVAEVQAAAGIIPEATPRDSGALAGLEGFLNAIRRTRAGRVAAR